MEDVVYETQRLERTVAVHFLLRMQAYLAFQLHVLQFDHQVEEIVLFPPRLLRTRNIDLRFSNEGLCRENRVLSMKWDRHVLKLLQGEKFSPFLPSCNHFL